MSDELSEAIRGNAKRLGGHAPFQRTALSPDAPAPRLEAQIAKHGPELTAAALRAWDARLSGEPIVDVAHELGLSIEAAKELIRQVHKAIHDDLKESLSLNREMDLARLDALLKAYYPAAKEGDLDAANFVVKALAHRAKLTGSEPPPDAGRSKPENVLVWIQAQLPQINRLVDALPLE